MRTRTNPKHSISVEDEGMRLHERAKRTVIARTGPQLTRREPSGTNIDMINHLAESPKAAIEIVRLRRALESEREKPQKAAIKAVAKPIRVDSDGMRLHEWAKRTVASRATPQLTRRNATGFNFDILELLAESPESAMLVLNLHRELVKGKTPKGSRD